MPRDYRKSTHGEDAPRNSSNLIGICIGILIGLIIAGIFYLKNQPHSPPILKSPQAPVNTNANSSTASQPPAPSSVNAKPKNTQALQTQFDFYNVLPSQKVVGPSGDEDTSQLPSKNPLPATAPTNTTPVTPSSPVPTDVANNTASENALNQAVTASTQPTTPPPPAASQKTSGPSATSEHPAKTLAKKTTPSSNPSKPPVVSTTSPSNYILQVGMFNNFNHADQLKAQLSLTGFEANISAVEKNGQTLQQVWVGPFSTLADAKNAQQQLEEMQMPGKLLKKS